MKESKAGFATENPAEVVVRYKDDATAFNNQKKVRWIRKES